MTQREALEKAVRVLGSQAALAEVCGGNVKQQHVSGWLNRVKKPGLPPAYAMKVQRATSERGETVYAWQLCPDAFSKDDIAA